jgi:hypothetical protein
MSSQVTLPGLFEFNSCLHATCIAEYQSTNFRDVQWAYFADDKDSARKLILNDEQFKLKAESMNSSFLKAVVVDTTYNWGGFPEDLADNAKAAGFDIIVLQEIGDEEYNCGIGAWFSNSRRCPIPIYRVPSQLAPEMSKAELVDLASSTDRNAAIVGVLLSLLCISTIALFGMTCVRLYGLGAPKAFNTGVCVCYLALVKSILNFQHSVMLLSGFVPDKATLYSMVVNGSIQNVLSLTATYLISREFEISLLSVRGSPQEGWKHSRVLSFLVFIILVDIGNLIIGPLVGLQVYGISNVFHSLMFLNCLIGGCFAVYFVWGYRQIVKVMSIGTSLGRNSRSVFMGRRLVLTVIFTILWLICAGLQGIDAVYYYNGMSRVLINLLPIFSVMITMTEVNAVPLKHGVLPLCFQKLRSNFSKRPQSQATQQQNQVVEVSQ